jgi:hypothetical protein
MKYQVVNIFVVMLLVSILSFPGSLNAQQFTAQYNEMKQNPFSLFKEPIGIAFLKFTGADNIDSQILEELKKQKTFYKKFTPFSCDILEKQKKTLKIKTLNPKDLKVLKALKELDISLVVTGNVNKQRDIELIIIDMKGKELLRCLFKDTQNSTALKDITNLFINNTTTEYISSNTTQPVTLAKEKTEGVQDEGILVIVTDQDNAEIIINNKDYSQNDKIALPFGSHKAVIRKNGFISIEDNIVIDSNQPLIKKYHLEMEKLAEIKDNTSSMLQISSNQKEAFGAQLFIGNELKGTAPLKIPLTPGFYKVTAKKAGFYDTVLNTEVKANTNSNIFFNMEPIVLKKAEKNRTWNWITTALTVGAGGLAAYMYFDSKTNYDNYKTAATRSAAKDYRSKTESSSGIFNIAFPISITALITTVYLWLAN